MKKGKVNDKYFRCAGKDVSLEELYLTLYGRLCIYSLHITGDKKLSEDVVSESFYNIISKVQSGVQIENADRYLYGIVRNLSLKSMQHYSKFEQLALDKIIDEEEYEENSHFESKLWDLVDNLPEKCREIFIMNKKHNKKIDDIAIELNVSSKTVANQLYIAKTKLRKLLSSTDIVYLLIFFTQISLCTLIIFGTYI